jgi:hypothetical protein
MAARPHWLTADEWDNLRGSSGDTRLIRLALTHALVGAPQDSESKRVTLDVARALLRMAGPAATADTSWRWLLIEVARIERAVGAQAVPHWWSPEDSTDRARTLVELAAEMEIRGIPTLPMMRRALLAGLVGEAGSLPDDLRPSIGEVLTGLANRRGPRRRKQEGDRADEVEHADRVD